MITPGKKRSGPNGAWLLLAVLVAGLVSSAAASDEVDHGIYAELLARHVRGGGVDYAGFKKEEARLDQYLELIERVDPERLPRQEQFAYYINAYNAWTIKLILTAYPGVKSIKDLGSLFQSPWKKEFVRIRGQTVTLDHIEHDILRPRFRDPRVHFAVNCASKSCPPLLAEPFRGQTLDAQLTRVTAEFLNQPANSRLEGDRLWVSSIFKWFAEDFNADVVGFYLAYAQGDLKRRLEAGRGRIEVTYMDYDWSLNGA
ncbi:MAG: DUF547 domain-containing protein [Desulfobacterales bacterium]|jgi:hypothetical protein|nr:DUF547 domain-containing protein [Desulfobacterales bacterium]